MKVRAQHDGTNEVIFEYNLQDNDLLNADIYAEKVADMYEMELSKSNGWIPVGCADFTITLADNPDSAVCWISKSYFFEESE